MRYCTTGAHKFRTRHTFDCRINAVRVVPFLAVVTLGQCGDFPLVFRQLTKTVQLVFIIFFLLFTLLRRPTGSSVQHVTKFWSRHGGQFYFLGRSAPESSQASLGSDMHQRVFSQHSTAACHLFQVVRCPGLRGAVHTRHFLHSFEHC